MGSLGLTRRDVALAAVLVGCALLVVAAALWFGAAAAFAAAGVLVIAAGLFLIDVNAEEAGRGIAVPRRKK